MMMMMMMMDPERLRASPKPSAVGLAYVDPKADLTGNEVGAQRKDSRLVVQDLVEFVGGRLVPLVVEKSDVLERGVLVHGCRDELECLATERVAIQVQVLQHPILQQRLGNVSGSV